MKDTDLVGRLQQAQAHQGRRRGAATASCVGCQVKRPLYLATNFYPHLPPGREALPPASPRFTRSSHTAAAVVPHVIRFRQTASERASKKEKERERKKQGAVRRGAERRGARDDDGDDNDTRRAARSSPVGSVVAERSGKRKAHTTPHTTSLLARSLAITLNSRQDGGRGGGDPVRAPRARHGRQDPRDRRIRAARHPRGIFRPWRQVLPRCAARRH